MSGQVRRKGSYGIDAPYLLPVLAVLVAANVVNGVVSGSVWPFLGAAVVLACAGCGLYTSRRGQVVGWGGVLGEPWLGGGGGGRGLGGGRGGGVVPGAGGRTTWAGGG